MRGLENLQLHSITNSDLLNDFDEQALGHERRKRRMMMLMAVGDGCIPVLGEQ
jgi:hypothetical protein